MKDDNDSFGSGAFGATMDAAKERESRKKGHFEFPDRAVDLIGLFLDPDIRAARDKVHNKIENGNLNLAGAVGGGVQNQQLTPPAQLLAKTVVNIHAIQKQATRDRNRQRR